MMWPLTVSDDLSARAGALADEHDLSGADAVHLASALAVGGDVIVAVWDRRLHRAAKRVGLAVAPATLA